MCVCVCVCVYVTERERERERCKGVYFGINWYDGNTLVTEVIKPGSSLSKHDDNPPDIIPFQVPGKDSQKRIIPCLLYFTTEEHNTSPDFYETGSGTLHISSEGEGG